MKRDRNDDMLELDAATSAFFQSLAQTPDVPGAVEAVHVAAAAAEAVTAPAEQSPAQRRSHAGRLIPRRVTSMSLPAFASLILSAKGAAAASAIAVATTGGLGAADLLPSQAQDAFDAVTGGATTQELVEDGHGPSTEGATGLDRAEEVTPPEAEEGLNTARDASAKGAEKSAAGKAKAQENRANAGGDGGEAGSTTDAAGDDVAAERKAEAQQRREAAAEHEDAARENAADEGTEASAEGREREEAARQGGAAREEAGRANAPTAPQESADDAEVDADSDDDASAVGDEAAQAGRGRSPQRD